MIEVTPINDSNAHDEGGMCHCCPQIEFSNGEMIVIHNSYDGREYIEEVNELLKNSNSNSKNWQILKH